MRANQKYLQCLIFWFSAWLPLALMAAPGRDFSFIEPEFETLHDADTIDNKGITALLQDQRGLIWIGTQNGLIRYDGYRFRKFAHKANDPLSLAGNYVSALMLAKDGRLWVGTSSDGISVFDPASERFEHFRHNDKDPKSLVNDTISAMVSDLQGGIWIGSNNGLDYLPKGSKTFIHFTDQADLHSLRSDKVRALLIDNTGRLWVGSTSALQRLAKDGKNFETFVADKNVRSLFQAQDGKLWLGTLEYGAAWLMPDSPQVHWLPVAQLGNARISSIAQVQTDQIWLATYGGGITIVAASDGEVLQNLRHDPELAGSLALDLVSKLMQDRAGWLWVGTWGGGLQRINANNTMLRLLRHSSKRPTGLSHPNVRSILELANGQLLIGTQNKGIDIFDRQQGLVGGYRADVLPDNAVLSMAQTKDGAIWAGTQLAGLVRQSANNTAWIKVQGLEGRQINTLLATRDGSLWAGTSSGLSRWRPTKPPPLPALETKQGQGQTQAQAQAQAPAHFEELADKQGKSIRYGISALTEDQEGRIWISAANGLWLHEPKDNSLTRIPAEPKRPDGLVSDEILALLFDSRGRMWVSTDKGLERLNEWDGKQARFEHISASLGQPGIALGENLMEDQQGRIWTESGVIDLAIMRMFPLSLADGMDIGAAWDGSHTQTRDGILLFGGTKGVAIIDPAHFTRYRYAPPLVVTELKVNGKTVAPGILVSTLFQPSQKIPPNSATSLSFDPKQRNFAIEFAALDFAESQKNRYQYRLQGYDKAWINTDAQHRSAAYGNLWPGLYTLQIRGSNRLGDWSTHELSIPIRVLPAWWQTWWFACVLFLGMAAFVFAMVQTRTRYLRQRQHELEHMVDERTTELRQKQVELVDANQELNDANSALNQSNEALNESNDALNEANADLILSVETLRQLGDIGREITANLDADIVFKSLYLYVGGLLDAPTMTIYRMNPSATTLDAVFGRDGDQAMPMRNIALDSPTSNAARAVRERQELLLHYDPHHDSSHIPGTRHMLTALFAPLIVDDKVLGVMSIQSNKENAYGERERLIFRTLTAYGAIALANAAALAALHQAQGQLVQQEKMASLGGLVAGIAHEINTPLGTTLVAISGAEAAWQTLQNAVASGRLSKSILNSSTTEGMEYTTLALKTASRAAELIALFKTISVNADSDRQTEIELAGYLQEVAALVQNQLAQTACTLEVNAPAGLRLGIVSEALTESLSRIMVNVLDHGFSQGRIGTLRLCAQVAKTDEGEDILITVSDNGHGIAAHDLPKVFDPFFTTKSGLHGHVGLGLHVAYNHVTQRLKGKISITSTLGEGTCVEIRLKKPTPLP